MKPTQAESPTVLPGDSLVPLESVLCTEELNRRPSRPPDYEKENRVLVALAQALADSPSTILQKMTEIMLETFRADSSGFSLLTKDDGGKRFYWPAISGVWKPHIGGGTPRDFGPCGDVLDRNAPLLFRHFERRYTYFLPVTPPVEECLLVPFYVEGKAVGTIWVIAHDNRREFDAEDLRQLVSLGRFASSAYQTVAFHEKTLAINEALMLGSLRQHELTEAGDKLNAQLQTEITERVRLERKQAIASERIAVLLQELGHRIKNSLQLIVSMVSLEARSHKSGEGKAALERVSHRIAALGSLYSMLGETNSVEEVDAASYLEALCRDLIESVQKENGTSIALKTDIASEPLPVDRAIPLGLIVNELVTNAIKYAFPSETSGTVVVTLKRIPGELRLTVSDDGKGIDPRRADSGLGGRLVDAFTRQLGGQVERKSDNKGTIVCLTFPWREASYDLRA